MKKAGCYLLIEKFTVSCQYDLVVVTGYLFTEHTEHTDHFPI